MRYTITFAEPLLAANGQPSRTDVIDLNPDVTSLTWSSQLPGGWNSATIGLARAVDLGLGRTVTFERLSREVTIRPYGHVRIWAGSQLCWEGRITRPERPGGDRARSLTVQGYGLQAAADGVFHSADTALTTSGSIVRQALAMAAPVLTAGNATQFLDPGVQHAPIEFDGKTPAQILDQVTKEGATVGVLVDYFVYGGRAVWIQPRLAPPGSEKANYVATLDDTTDTWSEDYASSFGALRVQYTSAGTGLASVYPPAGAPPLSDPTFPARMGGLERETVLSGGTLTDLGAAQFAQTQLSVLTKPTIACTLKRTGGGLFLPGGAEAPLHLVRAGQWVAVADQAPLIIVRSQFDANTHSLSLELGASSPGLPQLLQEFRRVAAHVKTQTAVTSGASL